MKNRTGIPFLYSLAVAGMTFSLGTVNALAQHIGHASLTDPQPLLPNTSHFIWATCTDDDGGFVDPCNLQYSTDYNPDTGGHSHNTGRESSALNKASSNAAGGDNVQITTKAYAQEECFNACPAQGGTCGVADYLVGNGLPDISLFWNGEHASGPNAIWYLNGAPPTRSTTGHGDINVNRYMQSNPAIGLYNATLDYLEVHSGSCTFLGGSGHQCKICTNDQSLPWGGLFDYEQTWAPPHDGHRDGTSADISATINQCDPAHVVNMQEMEAACEANGADTGQTAPHPPGSPNHTHCEW